MKYDLINIRTVIDGEKKHGGLSFVEGENDIPFSIKRIYFVYETKEGAHNGTCETCEKWKLLFCPIGEVEIVLKKENVNEKIVLDQPSKGLIIRPGLETGVVWKQKESVLCVAESE